MEYNVKEREVYCEECRKYFLTSDMDATCIYCEGKLITVLSSVVDGRKLTGALPVIFPFWNEIRNNKK